MATIIFDFWGTLVEQGIRSPIKQVKYALDINLSFSEYVVRMERAMMTTTFPSLREAFLAVAKEFSLTPSEETLERLIGLWNKNWMLAQPFHDTLVALEELKKNHQLVLIANTDAASVKNVLQKFKLEPFFSAQFFSYEVGLLKTDKSFLKHVLDDLHVELKECILVGDSLLSDMAAAERVGMKSVLVDRRGTREYPLKVTSLTALGEML